MMMTSLGSFAVLPESSKPALLALSVLIDRVSTLPPADRDDLFELLDGWRKAGDAEERRSIHRAMEEILAQAPIGVTPMPLDEPAPLTRGLKAWTEHVGRTIKELRERAGLNQTELAERAGLRQSHISRLENAEHSPTHLTLEKIAQALGVEVGTIDPDS